jgi:hypothetical protein
MLAHTHTQIDKYVSAIKIDSDNDTSEDNYLSYPANTGSSWSAGTEINSIFGTRGFKLRATTTKPETSEAGTGTETRPKNIAVYFIIKAG